MNLSKKLGAAAAGALCLALVGGGVTAANAAPGDPILDQPNGSKSGFFLYDANTGDFADGNPARVYTRDEALIASASATDVLAEINPAATRPVTGAASFTGVYRFLAEKTTADVIGGTNTWNAFALDGAQGPNGGTLTPDFTLNAINGGPGGIADDIAAGGSYWYGVAYTINNGVTVVGATYREINITAGTGNYTVGSMELEQAVAWAPDFASFTGTTEYKLRNGNIEINAGAGNANKTVDLWVEGTGKVGAPIVLDANGRAIVSSTIADGTRIALAEGETVVAWATAKAYTDVQPTGTDANKVTIANPAEGTSVVTIAAGIANANQTFRAVGWSTPTQLGNVTTDANGDATVDVAALGLGDHTVALFDSNDQVVAWGTFSLASSTSSLTDLSVTATTSNKFALESVNTAVNLGATKRGTTTTEVNLGAFTVVDDRDLLPGWTLNADVTDFVNASASNDVIGRAALGLAPKAVSTLPVGVTLASAQVAGAGVYSAIFAEGAADSSTLEAGTQFDAGLTFAVPASAKKGTYTSKLTLTLVTK